MATQRKPPAKRLFQGPAGSAFSRVNAELAQKIETDASNPTPGAGMPDVERGILETSDKKKRGRPPKYKTAMTSTERSWLRRHGGSLNAAISQVRREHADERGMYLTGAPHGKGLLVSGDHGTSGEPALSPFLERMDAPKDVPAARVKDQFSNLAQINPYD